MTQMTSLHFVYSIMTVAVGALFHQCFYLFNVCFWSNVYVQSFCFSFREIVSFIASFISGTVGDRIEAKKEQGRKNVNVILP